MLPINQVLVGDCINVMKGFPAESIDMVMFSPPYWGLRDYGVGTETVWGGSSDCEHEWAEEVCGLVHENRNNLRGSQEEVVGRTGTAWIRKYDQKAVGFCVKCGAWRGQLGLEPNFQMYIAHMVEVCREIKRVLKKTGSLYIVLGDTFMKKQKLGIPWRIRFALNEDGWISRSDIVWHKPNAMPASVKDRLNTTYEMIFHFVKQEKYYYDLDAIREPHTSLKDLGRKRLDTRTPKHDLAVKLGAGSIGPSGYLVQHPLGKNPGDVIRQPKWDDSDPHRTTTAKLHREGYGVGTLHPLGKNPGDVMSVTKHDLAVGRVGNFGYTDPLHVKEYHPKGKNPGDVIKGYSPHEPRHFQLSAMEGVKHGGHTGKTVRHDHPLGKNPGDIVQTKLEELDVQELIREVYRRLSRNGETYEGKNRLEEVNAKRLRAFDGRKIREAARQILKERQIPHSAKLVEFIHDHFSHPLGKNPGDVSIYPEYLPQKGWRDRTRSGNFRQQLSSVNLKGKNPDTIRCRTDKQLIRDRPLRPPHHPFRGDGWEGINPDMKPHPKGKNPGDVIQERTWQRAEEYHRKQGKLRSNGTVAGHYLDLLDVAKHYNSKGKNPGDIVKIAEEKGRPLNPPHHAERTRASDIDRMVYSGGFYHEVGKNPGDIVEDFSGLMNEVMKIYSKVTDVEIQEWEGKAYALDPQHNFRRLALNERKSRVRFEVVLDKLGIQDDLRKKLIAYWHNHSTHCLGKNPGDTIKIGMHHGSSLTSGRATHYEGQSIESHTSGSNPGDFWSINTKPFKGAHFAVYPEEICVKPILSSCPPIVCKCGGCNYEWYPNVSSKGRKGQMEERMSNDSGVGGETEESNFSEVERSEILRRDKEKNVQEQQEDMERKNSRARFGEEKENLGYNPKEDTAGLESGSKQSNVESWALQSKGWICESPNARLAIGKEGRLHAGAPLPDREDAGKTSEGERTSASQEWNKRRQQAGEFGNRNKENSHGTSELSSLWKRVQGDVVCPRCGSSEIFEREGIVLDPMCGSGTTLAVAKKLGRRYIGIEINSNYVDIATQRLLRISPQNPPIS